MTGEGPNRDQTTPHPKPGNQNPDPGTQTLEPETRSPKLGTQNPELGTWNFSTLNSQAKTSRISSSTLNPEAGSDIPLRHVLHGWFRVWAGSFVKQQAVAFFVT